MFRTRGCARIVGIVDRSVQDHKTRATTTGACGTIRAEPVTQRPPNFFRKLNRSRPRAHRPRPDKRVVGEFESRSEIPPPHLNYAHHNDDQNTDQKDSDRNSDQGMLIKLLDNPDNPCPAPAGDLKCQVHRVH